MFLPDRDQEQLVINRIHEKSDYGKAALYVPVQGSQIDLIDLPLQTGPRITPWGRHELMDLLSQQAEAQELSLQTCAERFTPVSVPENTDGWRYHPMLGFAKKKK
ncbi:hypothetical protein [Pseudomonas chlororaphis]